MDERVELELKKTQTNGATRHRMLELLDILFRWRRFVIINVLVVGVITTVIALLLPNWYKSTASVLPPKEQDMMGSLGAASSLMRGLTSGRIPGMGAANQGAYNYFAILKSRTAMEDVVRKFDLINVYKISDTSMEKAIKELTNNTAFETQEDDNITVEVLDKDPQRAAAMANYFVEILNDISMRLGTQEARSNREFIGRRLDRNKAELRAAEDSLRAYQEKTGTVVGLSSDNNSVVSPLAELYGLKAKKEIEVAILERTVSPDNPQLSQARMELAAIEHQVSSFPSIGISSLRLYRDVLIQQKIMEFLVPMYEQARVDEQKDLPVLLILDKAVPAEKKTKPQRSLIILLTTMVFLCAMVVAAFALHGALRLEGDHGLAQASLRQLAR
ncbi:MAG TPA: Wzz/FepE/Etk N-terminal domain-containing protein, partial [Bacteroidota bacterium]